MSTDWVLWGRYKGTPLRIMGGTLAEVRRERTYRSLIEANPGALTDLRVRKAGEPYEAQAVA
jgi:hypothetical protein